MTVATDPAATETDTGTETDPETDPAEGLDDHAAKVVTDIRKDFKRERAQRQAAERKVAEFERQAQAAADAQKTAEQLATEAAAASDAKAAGFRNRAVRAEVKALAAADFADPEDASAFLDLSTYADDEGDVDTEAIKADLDDLLSRKPHLARSDRPAGPRPDRSQGSGGNARSNATPEDTFSSWWKATSQR